MATRVLGSDVRTNRKYALVLKVMAKLLVHVNLIGGSELYLNNMTDQEHRSDENKENQAQRLTFANFRRIVRPRLCQSDYSFSSSDSLARSASQALG